MKIDRLLSMIVYLLNREIVSAKELSDKFGVSVRTIQRDMETLDLAGIPIVSIQGPSGGYSIMETYKMDRQLMSIDDLYFIITALKGIGSSLEDEKIEKTLEKITGIASRTDLNEFEERSEKLHIDFSMLGGNESQREVLNTVHKAVETSRLLNFSYTNNQLEASIRTVEPMTIVFKWRAWYLFGYCRLKNDYRIFRASKIRNPEIIAKTFRRRELTFSDFDKENENKTYEKMLDIKLRFSTVMSAMVEEYYNTEDIEYRDDKKIIVNIRMPESGWLYGYILSFGQFVEVLEPAHLRQIIKDSAAETALIYE